MRTVSIFRSVGGIIAALLTATVAYAQLPAPVTVATVESGRAADELRLTGTVTSERTASLSPRVSGLVERVRVDAGDRVAAGRALIDLDATMAKLALERTGAAVEEARAQLSEQQRLYDEAREMFVRGLVPETRMHAAEAERRVASARVDRLVAEQKEQQEVVRRHTLFAPFTGVVSSRHTDPGEWVETGTPVLELVDMRRLRIDVQAPQERYEQIAVGTAVTVDLDARVGKPLTGKVVARVPVNDPDARTFLVRVSVTAGSSVMTPGMSARVVFPLHGGAKMVKVPRDAIVRKPDGSATVWIINDGDTTTVSERRVDLGRSLRDWVDVRDGLEAGMRVVVRGNETLQEGQQVRILSTAPSTSGTR
jgi:RND family efflux transporter MFP subunit